MEESIRFSRLRDVDPIQILEHTSDPRIATHLPLLRTEWDLDAVAEFVDKKEACWAQHGLGHWAIYARDQYIGWGGFQKENDEWDYGLVLCPDAFGMGAQITRKAVRFAKEDDRISFITFLLPPSRKNQSGLKRMGAQFVEEQEYQGEVFLKYRLDTN